MFVCFVELWLIIDLLIILCIYDFSFSIIYIMFLFVHLLHIYIYIYIYIYMAVPRSLCAGLIFSGSRFCHVFKGLLCSQVSSNLDRTFVHSVLHSRLFTFFQTCWLIYRQQKLEKTCSSRNMLKSVLTFFHVSPYSTYVFSSFILTLKNSSQGFEKLGTRSWDTPIYIYIYIYICVSCIIMYYSFICLLLFLHLYLLHRYLLLFIMC